MNVPSYLPDRLTSEQLDAILHTGSPLLVIAGPGSGKTEVIAWRVAHLVQAGLVAPEHLLVTTFTNKAALELKDRIQQKLPDVHVEAMQVGTLHYRGQEGRRRVGALVRGKGRRRSLSPLRGYPDPLRPALLHRLPQSIPARDPGVGS